MRAFLTLTYILINLFVYGQTPISNAYFPAVGNVLITAKATNLSAFTVGVSPIGGNNLTWDFRTLRPQMLDTQRFIAPDTEGSRLFPYATLTFKPDTNKQIPFYRRTDSTFELIGLRGLLFQGIFIRVVVKPHTPLKERRAPLKLGDTYGQTAGFQVTFPPSVAPDSLLRNSPFAIPDSVRITYDVSRQDTVDAWGTARIPNGDFAVLRERQKESVTTKIEILYSFLGWLDVTTVILTGLTQPFYSERFYVNFWNATTQEPVAIIETDARYFVRTAQYKAINQRVGTAEMLDVSGDFSVFPNPVSTDLRINFEKIKTPIHSILIIDDVGRLVVNQSVKTEKMAHLSVNNWQNGVYIVCLMGEEGRVLGKKTFVKE
jgi:Secretion system C-terminal sorting domain